MKNIAKKDLGKNTFEFEVTVDKKDIASRYESAFKELKNNFKSDGFRKGKVPEEVAKRKMPKEDIYRQVINSLIPHIYKNLVQKESLKPVTRPKVELLKAKEDEDWFIKITVCEKPEIDITKTKAAIHKLNLDSKKSDIWVPGKSKDNEDDKKKEIEKRKHINSIFEEILKSSNIDVPDLLIEEELNKRLTQLIDDVRKAGLTFENYLKSKNETTDSIKKRLHTEIEEMFKLEFVLEEMADEGKIVVEQKDLDAFLKGIKDEKAKKEAQKNSYFYASILKRQKTLDYLLSL